MAEEPPASGAKAVLSAVVALRSTVSEEIRKAVLMLDLSVQRTRVVVKRLPDERARQELISQIEAIERLLHLARDVSQRV
jgi:hypothetical protein